jgi:acetyltransferase-like isoleucine patch superfamily enzyme
VRVRNSLLRPLRVRQFRTFGEDAVVDRPVWLYGARHMAIGARVIILRGAWLAVERAAWAKPAPALSIGDDVGIRVGCTISATESLIIEEHVSVGAYATIIDSKHTWGAGHPNVLFNPMETAPVRVGRGTWLADRATVAPGSDIGEQCAIGPNTTVSGKVPDFSIVLGNPGRVVGSTRT